MDFYDLIFMLVFLVVWIVLQAYILPKFGVKG